MYAYLLLKNKNKLDYGGIPYFIALLAFMFINLRSIWIFIYGDPTVINFKLQMRANPFQQQIHVHLQSLILLHMGKSSILKPFKLDLYQEKPINCLK